MPHVELGTESDTLEAMLAGCRQARAQAEGRAAQLEAALGALIDAHDAKDAKAIESALMIGRGLTF